MLEAGFEIFWKVKIQLTLHIKPIGIVFYIKIIVCSPSNSWKVWRTCNPLEILHLFFSISVSLGGTPPHVKKFFNFCPSNNFGFLTLYGFIHWTNVKYYFLCLGFIHQHLLRNIKILIQAVLATSFTQLQNLSTKYLKMREITTGDIWTNACSVSIILHKDEDCCLVNTILCKD